MRASVLITGCSTGVGRWSALALLERGHTVVATMRALDGRNAPRADSLREEAADAPGALHVVDLDVTSDRSVERAVTNALELAGPIDAVLNNAGYGMSGYLEAFTANQLLEMFDVNVFGVHRVNRAILPSMRARGEGLLIHNSSTMGRTVIPYAGPYTGSKYAVEGLIESLRYELVGTGVDVSILELGAFETAFHSNMEGPADDERGVSYGARAGRPTEFWTRYGETISSFDAAEPSAVTDAIAELVEAPSGTRPLRVVIDPITGGAGAPLVNEASERAQTQLLTEIGLAELLDEKPST